MKYDFEKYDPPYLSERTLEKMLYERENKKCIVLACILSAVAQTAVVAAAIIISFVAGHGVPALIFAAVIAVLSSAAVTAAFLVSRRDERCQ